MIIAIIDDGDPYPKCYECQKCKLPREENKCGKFSEVGEKNAGTTEPMGER